METCHPQPPPARSGLTGRISKGLVWPRHGKSRACGTYAGTELGHDGHGLLEPETSYTLRFFLASHSTTTKWLECQKVSYIWYCCSCVLVCGEIPCDNLPAARRSRAPHSQHRRQVLSSNTPDPNAYYTMTTPQAGDGNCLYAMMGVNGADPYPVRFESCTALQDTALWQFVSDTKGGFFISNKGWPGYRMEINDYHETIMYMNVANDSLLLQHWSIVSNSGCGGSDS